MNRRQFCTTLAGAGFVASAAPRKILVAAHAWVYAAPLPKYDFTPVLPQIFDDLTYAGIDAVELMERVLRHADAVDRIGDLSAKYKLPVIGTSYDMPMWDRKRHPEIVDDAYLVIERLAKLGGRTLGTSVGYADHRKTEAELDAQGEMVRKLTSICEQHKVVLNLHNHVYEVKDGEHDLKGTLQRVPDARLGPDLDWLTGAGIDPVDFIHRYGKRLVYCHLRDRKRDGVWSEAMGEGAIDYAAVGQALREEHFSGDLAIELAHPPNFQLTRPLRDDWKISREYVRRVVGY